MRLGKPPILEVYIRFDFPHQEEAPSLDAGLVGEFLESLGNLKPKDVTRTQDVRIQWAPGSQQGRLGIKGRIDRIRGCTEDETKWLQVGATYLVYNVLRRQEDVDYPGYEVLRDDALKYFERYREFFGEGHVEAVALHYVDVVSIPKSDCFEKPRLEEYFTLHPQVPEGDFGPTAGFEMSVVSACEGHSDTAVNVRLRRDSDDESTGAYRFRMEWDARCSGMENPEPSVLAQTLDRLHEELRRRFRACFTDTAWLAFEPEKGG